jgi:Trypsin-co-occurring domain 2
MAEVSNQVELADLLDYVATQLSTAADRAKERPTAVMEFLECELDMAIQIEANAKAGIRVWVVELGGGIKRSDTNTIKLKFRGLPVSDDPVDLELPAQGRAPTYGGGGGIGRNVKLR